MLAASAYSIVLGTFLGDWEVILILSLVVLLFVVRKLPEVKRGMGAGVSEFRKAMDQEAQDAGKSTSGIFGKPAAEALTPNNETGELYEPAVFHRDGKRRACNLLRELWHGLLKFLGLKKAGWTR